MKVLLRQTIDLYGVRYGVGLRDIPDGHACGADWDCYVKAGWIVPQDKPKAVEAVAVEPVAVEAAQVAEVAVEVADVVAESDVVDSVPVAEAAQVAEKPSSSKKK